MHYWQPAVNHTHACGFGNNLLQLSRLCTVLIIRALNKIQKDQREGSHFLTFLTISSNLAFKAV